MSEIPQGTPPEARQGKPKPLVEKAVNLGKEVEKVIKSLDVTKKQPYQSLKENVKKVDKGWTKLEDFLEKDIDTKLQKLNEEPTNQPAKKHP